MDPIIGDKNSDEQNDSSWHGYPDVPTSESDDAAVALLKGEAPAPQIKHNEPTGHVAAVLEFAKEEKFQKSEIGGEGYQPSASADEDVVVPTVETARAFDGVDVDVSDEDDEPDDSLTRENDMVARESQEKYADWWTNKSGSMPVADGVNELSEFLEKATGIGGKTPGGYTKKMGPGGKPVYVKEGEAKPKGKDREVDMAKWGARGFSALVTGGGMHPQPMAVGTKVHAGDKTYTLTTAPDVKFGEQQAVFTESSGNKIGLESLANQLDKQGGTVSVKFQKSLEANQEDVPMKTYIGGLEAMGDFLEKGVVATGKRGGKIYGYDSKGKPIYSEAKAKEQAGKKEAEPKKEFDLLAMLEEVHKEVGELKVNPEKAEPEVMRQLDRIPDMMQTRDEERGFKLYGSSEAQEQIDQARTQLKKIDKLKADLALSPKANSAVNAKVKSILTHMQEMKSTIAYQKGKFSKPGSAHDPKLAHRVIYGHREGKGHVTAPTADVLKQAEALSPKTQQALIDLHTKGSQKGEWARDGWASHEPSGAHAVDDYLADTKTLSYNRNEEGNITTSVVEISLNEKGKKLAEALASKPTGDKGAMGIVKELAKDKGLQKVVREWHTKKAAGNKAEAATLKALVSRVVDRKAPNLDAKKKAVVMDTMMQEAKYEKSMTGIEAMNDFLEKAEALPTGDSTSMKKKKSAKQGESADGGELEGVGMTSGEAPLVGGQIPKVGPGKSQKLSEDDADEEGQMKPHKKPIESTKKSSMPADQRHSVAHANAVAASKLRKAAGEQQLSADEQAAELVKSEDFYSGGVPTLNMHRDVNLNTFQNCEHCEKTFSKSLTACPECGAGTVSHRPVPGAPHMHQVQISDPSKGMLRKSAAEEDICIGGPVQSVRMVSHGGTVRRR